MEEPTEEAMEEPTEEMMEGPVEEGLVWTPERAQAVAAAIDREALVDRVFEGRNIPAYHMVPTGYPYATESLSWMLTAHVTWTCPFNC